LEKVTGEREATYGIQRERRRDIGEGENEPSYHISSSMVHGALPVVSPRDILTSSPLFLPFPS
jgi:hypothetical protein